MLCVGYVRERKFLRRGIHVRSGSHVRTVEIGGKFRQIQASFQDFFPDNTLFVPGWELFHGLNNCRIVAEPPIRAINRPARSAAMWAIDRSAIAPDVVKMKNHYHRIFPIP